MNKILLIIIYICFFKAAFGQKIDNTYTLFISVTDETGRESLPSAWVELTDKEGRKYTGITDLNGKIQLHLPLSMFQMKVSYVGYRVFVKTFELNHSLTFHIQMYPGENLLDEVVVTASESKGLSTSSHIDRTAMGHLQPTGFSDLLELLPGGIAKDPSMGTANLIRIREAGAPSSHYDISSLGTSFVVDGIPLSGDANLQATPGASSLSGKQQGFVSKGIDMRSIPIDNIESVEVIRGIPSAEYGDLTGGVVKIHRKNKTSPFEARFKSDQFSKLFYAGKGFAIGNHQNILNVSLDYLDSKTDPRNNMENYKRLTGSLRFSAQKHVRRSLLEWNSHLDYSGSFDNEKKDIDTDEKQDRFRSSYNRMAWGNTFRWKPLQPGFLHLIEISSSLSLQLDKLEQTKNVYLNMPSSVPNSMTEGEHDGLFLPSNYLAHLTVDGKPFNAFLKLKASFSFQTFRMKHSLLAGAEYSVDKNYGKGELYDSARPVSPSMRGRPRPYKDIPALQKLSIYAEDRITIPVGKHLFSLLAGIRFNTMLGLNDGYSLQNKIYPDPRANARWKFPEIMVTGKDMTFSVGGGYGIQTKTPTMAQLYPGLIYYDIEEMNYYHNNPDYRRLYLMTYIWNPANHGLRAARNRKWELSADIVWAGNRLSVTYFRESCRTGFRAHTALKSLSYKRYDTSGIDPDKLTAPPDPSVLPYKEIRMLTGYGQTKNGSRIDKEGIEFQFQSKRIPKINTRITLNGAWFNTLYNIDAPVVEHPSIVLNGERYPYYGIYDSNDGNRQERFNTNLIIDTYLPRLGLTFSTSAQCMWFTKMKTLPKNRVPYAYVDEYGEKHPYTHADETDPVRQWLVRKEYSVTEQDVPFAMIINLKATKQLGKHINLALFVNKILDYTPDYQRNGLTIHRSVSPYFGMEANLKF
ncbi:MAG: TonB-dependent receptor [Bacteroides pyogenes]|uniref:TonB-dependent receptor n=1 Tax=Bacteroides pyogenes TaxID=310300 RepID=UPI0024322AF1|nr:TonB-dependent receptor plug domain-containing protein [Bacteroides pyogenes]MCI7069696.1 TonB-dependent receptor [Bacteroides pyogenes]MDY5353390.1 TonB-dependent receptor plug domain-containing protein [Bacteroides pyogenes]